MGFKWGNVQLYGKENEKLLISLFNKMDQSVASVMVLLKENVEQISDLVNLY